MKTVEDLVDRLNDINHLKPFSIERYYDKRYLVVEYSIGTKNTAVEFSQLNYRFHKDISYLDPIEQNIIVDYLANSSTNDWFEEKKYNIIIGQNNNEEHFTVYRRNFANDGFIIDDAVLQNDLIRKGLIFTESEIEELKSQLPENMAKIVDLGKVEVKDD